MPQKPPPDLIDLTLTTALAGIFLAAVWRLGSAFSAPTR